MRSRTIIAAAASFAPAVHAGAVRADAIHAKARAGEQRPVERKVAGLPHSPSRGRATLWIEGGVGAIVPLPAGGGGGLTLAYELAVRTHLGVFGHCTGASAGPTGPAGSEAAKGTQRAGLLCDVGFVAGMHGEAHPLAAEVEVGVGWGFVDWVDESRRPGAYRGTGALIAAQAGVRIVERYQAMLRADVPLFRAAFDGAGDTIHGWSFVGEFGFRLF